ncbi:hypothetical protein BRD56_01905 [Thermoplasmatales archaeon SW_10_69_26]|nr:MAG: hypothetical protein BRD56_01905 [Thermoplasmatales archaeon SW_10_69_26]
MLVDVVVVVGLVDDGGQRDRRFDVGLLGLEVVAVLGADAAGGEGDQRGEPDEEHPSHRDAHPRAG